MDVVAAALVVKAAAASVVKAAAVLAAVVAACGNERFEDPATKRYLCGGAVRCGAGLVGTLATCSCFAIVLAPARQGLVRCSGCGGEGATEVTAQDKGRPCVGARCGCGCKGLHVRGCPHRATTPALRSVQQRGCVVQRLLEWFARVLFALCVRRACLLEALALRLIKRSLWSQRWKRPTQQFSLAGIPLFSSTERDGLWGAVATKPGAQAGTGVLQGVCACVRMCARVCVCVCALACAVFSALQAFLDALSGAASVASAACGKAGAKLDPRAGRPRAVLPRTTRCHGVVVMAMLCVCVCVCVRERE